MLIKRDQYLDKLINKMNNGLIKVITGVRRCGKSFLVFKLFKDYLIESGVMSRNIIALQLDAAINAKYRDPLLLSDYLKSKIIDNNKYYILLDEIQFVDKKKINDNPLIYLSFYDVLNELLTNYNVDIYITGSNSKMLSKDISTEFRGRSTNIYITPLSFKEYYDYIGGSKEEALSHYMLYGGMPLMLLQESSEEKRAYLKDLFNETYFKDIIERNTILYPNILDKICDFLCSNQASYTSANKIANTLKSEYHININSETISRYLNFLTDSFIFKEVNRYDVKGKAYLTYLKKYFCIDTGLNNARLNFRKFDEGHILENIVYNELIRRGFSVDVGAVETTDYVDGKPQQKTLEIDFVINAESSGEKYYIQVANDISDASTKAHEIRPFLKLKNDFTKRILITKTFIEPWTDEYGIKHIGIYDFLLNDNMI